MDEIDGLVVVGVLVVLVMTVVAEDVLLPTILDPNPFQEEDKSKSCMMWPSVSGHLGVSSCYSTAQPDL